MGRPSTNQQVEKIRTSIERKDDSMLSADMVQLKAEAFRVFDLMMGGEHTTRSLVLAIAAEFGHALPTCYARVRFAKDVFREYLQGDRSTESMMLLQRAEKNLEECDDIEDVKERVEARDKVMNTIMKLRGLDKVDESGVDPAKLEPSDFYIKVPKAVLLQLQGMVGMGYVDLGERLKDIPEAEVITNEAPAADGPPG